MSTKGSDKLEQEAHTGQSHKRPVYSTLEAEQSLSDMKTAISDAVTRQNSMHMVESTILVTIMIESSQDTVGEMCSRTLRPKVDGIFIYYCDQ